MENFRRPLPKTKFVRRESPGCEYPLFDVTFNDKLDALNYLAELAYENGTPLIMEVKGSPDIQVFDLHPLRYNHYDDESNPLPHLNGEYTLRSVIGSAEEEDEEEGLKLAMAVIEGEQGTYGYSITNLNILTVWANELGAHIEF